MTLRRDIYGPFLFLLLLTYAGAIFFSQVSRNSLQDLLSYSQNVGDLSAQTRILQLQTTGEAPFSNLRPDVRNLLHDTAMLMDQDVFRFLGRLDENTVTVTGEIRSTVVTLDSIVESDEEHNLDDLRGHLGDLASDFDTLSHLLQDLSIRQVFAFQSYFFLFLAVFVLTAAVAFGLWREHIRERADSERRRQLSVALLQMRDSRDRALSQELHDTIAQELYSARLSLQLQNIDDCDNRLADTARMIRTLSHSLHVRDTNDLGLKRSIQALVDDLSTTTTVLISCQFRGLGVVEIPSSIGNEIYHIAREAIRNAIQHAAPSQIDVTLSLAFPLLQLIVRDDGSGFDPNSKARGIGITIMRERTHTIGGELQVHSNSYDGTAVNVRVLIPIGSNIS